MESIKETKDIVKFIVAGFRTYGAASADGKIGFEDIGHLMLMLPHIQPAFEGVEKIPAEFKDLSAEEALELATFIKQELSVGDEKVAAIVEAAFGIILHGYKLYAAINQKAEVVA